MATEEKSEHRGYKPDLVNGAIYEFRSDPGPYTIFRDAGNDGIPVTGVTREGADSGHCKAVADGVRDPVGNDGLSLFIACSEEGSGGKPAGHVLVRLYKSEEAEVIEKKRLVEMAQARVGPPSEGRPPMTWSDVEKMDDSQFAKWLVSTGGPENFGEIVIPGSEAIQSNPELLDKVLNEYFKKVKGANTFFENMNVPKVFQRILRGGTTAECDRIIKLFGDRLEVGRPQLLQLEELIGNNEELRNRWMTEVTKVTKLWQNIEKYIARLEEMKKFLEEDPNNEETRAQLINVINVIEEVGGSRRRRYRRRQSSRRRRSSRKKRSRRRRKARAGGRSRRRSSRRRRRKSSRRRRTRRKSHRRRRYRRSRRRRRSRRQRR